MRIVPYIRIKALDYEGASGVYDAEGAARVRCFVTNDEGGAFDVWARADAGKWVAFWPAILAHDRSYTIRAELWNRTAHVQAPLGE